jgi:hypothetical protein
MLSNLLHRLIRKFSAPFAVLFLILSFFLLKCKWIPFRGVDNPRVGICAFSANASKSFSGLFGVKPPKMLGHSSAMTLRFPAIFHSKIPRKPF